MCKASTLPAGRSFQLHLTFLFRFWFEGHTQQCSGLTPAGLCAQGPLPCGVQCARLSALLVLFLWQLLSTFFLFWGTHIWRCYPDSWLCTQRAFPSMLRGPYGEMLGVSHVPGKRPPKAEQSFQPGNLGICVHFSCQGHPNHAPEVASGSALRNPSSSRWGCQGSNPGLLPAPSALFLAWAPSLHVPFIPSR